MAGRMRSAASSCISRLSSSRRLLAILIRSPASRVLDQPDRMVNAAWLACWR
jgi:hypothetical protein